MTKKIEPAAQICMFERAKAPYFRELADRPVPVDTNDSRRIHAQGEQQREKTARGLQIKAEVAELPFQDSPCPELPFG